MLLDGLKIGFALTGSFCTFAKIFPELEKMASEGADIYPVLSGSANELDTRFGCAEQLRLKLKLITGKEIISSISGAEPFGPKALLDVLVVAPCTGNTLGKLASGITDTSVTMACKAHLRNQRPLILGISTNDGLGINAMNLGLLLNSKNIYFVPFGQDDPVKKVNSLVARFDLLIPTIIEALKGKQLQPLLV